MDRNTFINQVANRLREMNVPYQTGNNADISISATFKKQNEPVFILYFASVFLNQEKNTVYAYEKAMIGNEELSKKPNFGQIAVVTSNDNNAVIPIGSILGSIAYIASSLGLYFEKTDDEQAASYPPEPIPVFAGIPKASQGAENNSIFCTNCGAKMKAGTRFCSSCGNDFQQTSPPQPYIQNDTPPVFAPIPPNYQQMNMNTSAQNNAPKGKKSNAAIILISILVIGVLVAVGLILGPGLFGKKPGSSQDETTAGNSLSVSSNNPSGSAVISSGVNSSDLGNVMNGQFYFATDENIFYASFDTNDKAHIYSAKKDGSDHKAIFDGFGWSLVVIDDWLYFSGNQGAAIDGTYTIFRMKLDGSQLEKINNEYSYGMFLYGEYLYYMKNSTNYQDPMSICRSSLDGSNEEVLFTNGLSPVIFENKLYYYDNQGNMYRTEPDGSNAQVLMAATVKFYVLSGNKIVYNDFSNNIYTCDLDGNNNKLIRGSTGVSINNVNAYDGRIFFSEYDTNFNYTSYGYNYTIKSCNMDGSDEISVVSSVSYGIYMNIVDNKLMLLDYALNSTSGVMNAVINVMNLDGSNRVIMQR